MKSILAISLSIYLLSTGCSRTKAKNIVLLGENGREHNAIVVSTLKGSQRVDKVRGYVGLNSQSEAPSRVRTMSKKEFESRFSATIASMPESAISYILHFEKGALELTASSQKEISEIVELIIAKAPCEVDFIGHTDSVGLEEENIKKAYRQADYVESIFKQEILKRLTTTKDITLRVEGYGEVDQLISTADNVAEERNRNVEVFIK